MDRGRGGERRIGEKVGKRGRERKRRRERGMRGKRRGERRREGREDSIGSPHHIPQASPPAIIILWVRSQPTHLG